MQADPVQFDVVSEGPIDPGAEPKEVEVSTYVAGDGEPIARALLMAKAIHQRGDDLSRTGSDLDAMIAIHHVHLAVEMALREVASRRRMPYQKRDPTFDDLLQFVEASLNDSGHITALPHLQRNSVQHAAQLVHRDTVKEQCIITRSFLRELYRRAFNVEYDEVSERDLVADGGLRALLHHAHTLARIGSSEALSISLAALRFCLESALQSWPSHLPAPEGLSLNTLDRGHYMMDRIQVLEEETTLLATGVDVLEYRWLLQHAPGVLLSDDGSITVDTTGIEVVDLESVRRAERFVIGCIMSWQRMSLNPRYVEKSASSVQFAGIAEHLGAQVELGVKSAPPVPQ